MIPYGRQDVDPSDIEAVSAVLRSDYLTQGPVVREFEQAVADVCGSRKAVVANSATSALHLACMALGVGSGDEVWTSPVTFVASANCAIYCGARVDFIDIDRRTFNMDAGVLADRLKGAASRGVLPKVVIPVHLAGTPCDMTAIVSVCREYGVAVLQDASHSLGATIGARSVLGPDFGDVAVTSFHPVKMITSAEGGAAVTSNADLANHMVRLRSHGITRAPHEMEHAPDGPWYYEQLELGFNFRMPDLFAALGLSQLRRLDQFIQRRNDIADAYTRLLDPEKFALQVVPAGVTSSRHLVIAIPDYTALRTSQRELFERLHTRGIMANLHYIPVYKHPFHRARLIREPECPNAEWYYARAITLPCFPAMSDDGVSAVVAALTEPVGHQTIF
jgi:UDP-4-amino-4,6-dideoxy-N-acetyl-beta-L-altrosamine transaminase